MDSKPSNLFFSFRAQIVTFTTVILLVTVASLYFLSNYHNAGGMIVEDGNCALDFTSQSRNRDMSWARWNLNRSKL